VGVIGLIFLFVVFVLVAGNKKFDAPYPDVAASIDPDVIARGEYLVFGPAHCATCHVPMDKIEDVESGLKMPLIGGWEIDIPPVTLRATNLTPDKKTGIGNRTDGELARTIRYGVTHDGRFLLPVMPYGQMSDEDLEAIISYLRSQPVVENNVEPSKYKFIGKALLALGVLKPQNQDYIPVKKVPNENMVAYGEYLAKGVANCMGCHTATDLMSGKFTVPPFAGGFVFESEGYAFVSPNLTTDDETGIMTYWTEETFVKRFKAGRLHKTSPMPWGSFSRMDSTELKAIYQFLKTLEPINNPIGKTVYLPGEKIE
jgi:mono/diheme cytochrome c family protein